MADAQGAKVSGFYSFSANPGSVLKTAPPSFSQARARFGPILSELKTFQEPCFRFKAND